MKAKFITATPSANVSSIYVFEKKFTTDDSVKNFNVRISADTRYRFYLNGIELSNGPCKSTKERKYYEELECSDALIAGENELRVVVLHIAPLESISFSTAYHLEKPALYFDGTIVNANGEEKIVSDESFSVRRMKNVSFTHHKSCMASLAPFEIIDGDDEYEELKCDILYEPHLEKNCFQSWGVKENYRLEKRPIQILDIKQKEEIKQVREYYDDNGMYNVILDASAYTTAMLKYELKAAKGTKLNLVYIECPLTKAEDGSLYKGMRDNIYGEFQYGTSDNDHYDEIIASGNAQTYEPFWYRVFRFIRIECSEKPEYLRVFAARYTYDFTKDAINGGVRSFECSDKRYEKFLEISRNTLECCTHETFADCPYYEQQQYVGDGRFESMFAWTLSNDSKMQKKLLLDTMASQQTDGQIATTSPNVWVQIIHISNILYIDLAREYLRFTNDVEFTKSLISSLCSVIHYFESVKTPEGLVNPPDGCKFLDWVSSWKRGFPEGGDTMPMTLYSIFLAHAYRKVAEICDACDFPGLASDYRVRYDEIADTINKLCFDKETGLYIDVYGIKSFSNLTNTWAITSGVADKIGVTDVARNMMIKENVAKASFSKCYDLLRALDIAGLYDDYVAEILAQWDEMVDKHCTTWGESLSFPRSECHGWSCLPMYETSAMILGVTPLKNGFEKVQIKPHTLGLSYAKGRVPTTYGYIDVSWTNKGGIFSLDVSSSKEVEMEIVLPNGKTETVTAKQYSTK